MVDSILKKFLDSSGYITGVIIGLIKPITTNPAEVKNWALFFCISIFVSFIFSIVIGVSVKLFLNSIKTKGKWHGILSQKKSQPQHIL